MAAGDGSLVTFSVSDGLLELAEIKSQGKEAPMEKPEKSAKKLMVC